MSGVRARLIALPAIALGAGVGWFFGFKALQDARARAPQVEFSGKGMLLASLLVFAGAFLLVGGAPVLAAFSGPPKGRQHAIVWPMFALACLAAGASWWWLRGQLQALGYAVG